MFVAQDPTRGFDLTLWRPVAEIVHDVGGASHPRSQVRRVVVHGCEHEATKAFGPQFLHAVLRVVLVEVRAFVALEVRHAEQFAVQPEAPAVITAAERRNLAAGLVDELGALVAAAIVQHVHRAVVGTDHDDGHLAVIQRDVVALLRYLALMADVDPCPRPDALHLEIENLGIGVDVSMYPRRLDEVGNLFFCISHDGSSVFLQHFAARHGDGKRFAGIRWLRGRSELQHLGILLLREGLGQELP